jgi:hypothetical protein
LEDVPGSPNFKLYNKSAISYIVSSSRTGGASLDSKPLDRRTLNPLRPSVELIGQDEGSHTISVTSSDSLSEANDHELAKQTIDMIMAPAFALVGEFTPTARQQLTVLSGQLATSSSILDLARAARTGGNIPWGQFATEVVTSAAPAIVRASREILLSAFENTSTLRGQLRLLQKGLNTMGKLDAIVKFSSGVDMWADFIAYSGKSESITVCQRDGAFVDCERSLVVEPEELELTPGRSAEVTAVLKDFDGDPVSPQPAFAWTSEDTDVVTVEENGEGALITAVGPGQTVVFAEGADRSGAVTVTVLATTTDLSGRWTIETHYTGAFTDEQGVETPVDCNQRVIATVNHTGEFRQLLRGEVRGEDATTTCSWSFLPLYQLFGTVSGNEVTFVWNCCEAHVGTIGGVGIEGRSEVHFLGTAASGPFTVRITAGGPTITAENRDADARLRTIPETVGSSKLPALPPAR